MGRLRAFFVRSRQHTAALVRHPVARLRGNRAIAAVAAALTLSATGGVVLSQSPGVSAASVTSPSGVSVTLSGCRNDGTITLPIGGKFVCPDSAYTTGNLGKGWNELDLVPYRLETSSLHATPSPDPFTLAIVVDNCSGTDGVTGCAGSGDHPGYDVVSVPVVNTALSSGTCSLVSTSAEQYQPPSGTDTGGLGGTGTSLYRTVTISQTSGSDCFFDYYARLALGSHLYPGSSLHADLALIDSDGNLSTSGIGARDVSIPVKEISPQVVAKDMSASENSSYIWHATKLPSPVDLPFSNTCTATTADLQASVTVTAHYVRDAANPTGFTVITDVTETNPASRTIDVSGTDAIYSGTTLLTTDTFPLQAVGPNSSVVLQLDPSNPTADSSTHNYAPSDLPDASNPSFNDTATLSFTDQATGVPVPGNVTTTFTLPNDQIGNGTATNSTADLTDDTTLSDTGGDFQYSIDSVSVAGGTLTDVTTNTPYTLGTETTDEILWKLSAQSASVDPVVFGETVYVKQAATDTATLSDTVSALNGTTVLSHDTEHVDLSASPLVSLTINKTINVVLGTGDSSYTFTFDVASNPAGYSTTKTISFGSGDGGTSNPKSTTITGLQPGTYDASEETPPSPWTGSAATSATITPNPSAVNPLSTCSGSVGFQNTAGPASARVQKVTIPSGHEGNWYFTLTGPGAGTSGETVHTTDTSFVNFNTVLEEGSYTVTETAQTGWFNTGVSEQENSGTVNDQTSAHQCTFTVNYPADADAVYSCVFTNTLNATARVKKITVPSGHEGNWYFTLTGPGAGTSGETVHTTDTGFVDFTTLLQTGSYTVTETAQNGWTNTGVSEQLNSGTANNQTSAHQCTFTVAYPDDAGGVFSCTFTNTELSWIQVTKTLNGGSLGTNSFNFSLTGGPSNVNLSGTANASDNGVVTFGYDSTNHVGTLLPSPPSYTLCETGTNAGWSAQWTVNGNPVTPATDPSTGNVCYSFSLPAGSLPFAFTVDNVPPPGGGQRTIGYWKNWSCEAPGNQSDRLSPLLPIQFGSFFDNSCTNVVTILSNPGAKYAENQLAAQLAGAELNVAAGAGTCPAVTADISHANSLLTQIGYNPANAPTSLVSNKGPLSSYRTDILNTATELNDYNNGLLFLVC